MAENYSRLISDSDDQYEVYDMEDLEVVTSKKALAASASRITSFQIMDVQVSEDNKDDDIQL